MNEKIDTPFEPDSAEQEAKQAKLVAECEFISHFLQHMLTRVITDNPEVGTFGMISGVFTFALRECEATLRYATAKGFSDEDIHIWRRQLLELCTQLSSAVWTYQPGDVKIQSPKASFTDGTVN